MDSDTKRTHLLEALKSGVAVLRVDARRPEVVVPDAYRDFFDLPLNVSYRFNPPDLDVSEWGVRATLSFRGVRSAVALPWAAVWGIASRATGGGWLYPADIPPEWEPTEPPRRRGHLRLLN